MPKGVGYPPPKKSGTKKGGSGTKRGGKGTKK